jgi:long-chain acyl-CoA synthetase
VANVTPVHREIQKYRWLGTPFYPIRFLDLLPLSHMFGQAMATFIPPLLSGVVVFMRGYNPGEIVHQIRSRRVSVLVCVPKILDVLHQHVERLVPGSAEAPAAAGHWLRRWWRHRRVHRMLGLKFWSFVVGAAPLDPELERFWSRLGFLVVQGYGLTETAPIVTLNHPFRASAGTVGAPIAGVEVSIAPDGEILVRGENVTKGYYQAEAETAEAFADGWFHTGDIGRMDEAGRLLVRGRKKEMIVTPEGLNVFPEVVERVLDEVPGVRESVVVGRTVDGQERVHGVLVLEGATDPETVVRQANARLEEHQKLRGASVWPGGELPRTDGTRKLKRREVKRWLEGTGGPAGPAVPTGVTVQAVVGEFATGRQVRPDTTVDELGLSSLDRVELLMVLEERFQTTIDEAAFAAARTVGDLQTIVDATDLPAGAAAHGALEPIDFPAWNRTAAARLVRRLSLPSWILPLQRLFTPIRVEGLEHLRETDGPVVFASNHQSHMDVPVILKAMPAARRYRVAPAMAKEFFRAHFFPAQHTWRQVATNRLNYYLAALFFNAFPLPQREAGTRQTLRYVGEILDGGDSILIFPEGKRTDHGEIHPFQAGIGMIGSRLDVPVVPVRIVGLDRVLHHSWSWPRRGPVVVRFGAPLRLRGDDFAALARRVEEAVRAL